MSTTRGVGYMGRYLEVKYTNQSGGGGSKGFTAEIQLKNAGLGEIPSEGWKLMLHHIHPIAKEILQMHDFLLVAKDQLKMRAIQGNLYSVEPTEKFKPLLPGTHITFIVFGHLPFSNKYKTVYPNWYVWFGDLEPVILESTTSAGLPFVEGFDGPDANWGPADRFNRNKFRDLKRFGQPVIPTPVEYRVQTDIKSEVFLSVDGYFRVTFPNDFENEGRLLEDKLSLISNKKENSGKRKFHISLKRGKAMFNSSTNTTNLILEDAYSVQISRNGCIIMAENPSGMCYGTQTLLSLLANDEDHLPTVHITDAPRYKVRSFMLDISRNFFNIHEIKLIIDMMATYKLNTLHLHLTDDQGWRLEFPGLPELTQVGSQRCHTTQEDIHLFPYHGTHPLCKYTSKKFLSVENYVDLLKYAKDRHVRIQPEFDFPGHSHAAVVAMAYRTKRLSEQGEQNEFEIKDRLDTSVHYQVGGYKDTTINPCMNTTYNFLDFIVSTIVLIHKPIQPLEYLHLGGDEVPESAFESSPACLDFLSRSMQMIKPAELQQYFIIRARMILHKHDLKLAVWEDGMMTSMKEPLDLKGPQKDIMVNIWKRNLDGLRSFSNKNYQVVDSSSTHLYLDHSQDPSQLDRGFNWATNFTDAQKIFEYKPMCLDTASEVPIKADRIIGIQASLWTELVWTNSQLEKQLFPRLFAFAQKAWYKASWEDKCGSPSSNERMAEDYELFINSVSYKELARLDRLGIQYYIPPPGVRLTDGKIEVNSAIPGLPILYSQERGQALWQKLNSPINHPASGGVLYFITRGSWGVGVVSLLHSQ
ncbi:hypothetical protein CAPTEDRAFT_204144 [Capitella teleta]|uniref:beta-N-acetylhexosaminidase n=1 Tax=Capitella teleta TaxID=283909 RepID=R7U5D9_CAPTE|nr:hypothetical protein CAPTEDRAFT_204144 [Capitella teleta]|eukprot:ELU01585.1 hypothetical protein CAPTEDRAFT_204144 [Capitella teleta]